MKTTIEQRFAEGLRYAEKTFGKKRGFQARLSDMTGVRGPNINDVLRRDKGVSEQRRRAMFHAALELVPSLPPKGYDDFLAFGQHLLDGNAPEDWKPAAVVFKGGGHLHIKPTVKESLTVEPPTVAPGPGLHLADRHAFTLVPKARARLSAGGGSSTTTAPGWTRSRPAGRRPSAAPGSPGDCASTICDTRPRPRCWPAAQT